MNDRCAVLKPAGWRGEAWTDEELAYIREHFPVTPAKEIAAHLGRSYSAVLQRGRTEGLPSWHRAGINSLVKDYFRVIDTPMKAYLLGLLASDGSVSKAGQLKLELHQKDRCLVELMRDELAPAARTSDYRTRTSPMCRFMISSPDLVADLAQHGVVNAKTLITEWPAGLPVHLENSFVCGYFDGDGSLNPKWIYRWAIVSGNPEFMGVMQGRIMAHTGVKVGGPYEDKRHNAAWSIVATGEPVRALDAWIHRDVPGLARKRFPTSDVPPLWGLCQE